jgi:hypothetical protein
MAKALAPVTTSPSSAHPHPKDHSKAEGTALVLGSLAAVGIGLWFLLEGSGGPTITTCPCGTAGCPACTSSCDQANGTLVSTPEGAVYVIQNGQARGIPSKAIFDGCGYEASAVIPVQDSDIATCPGGTAIGGAGAGDCPPAPLGSGFPSIGTATSPGCPMGCGLLAQVAGSAGVYIVDCNCVAHGIVSMAALDACGYGAARIYPVLPAILAATPQGAPITGAGDCVPLYGCNDITTGPCAGTAPGAGGPGPSRNHRRHQAALTASQGRSALGGAQLPMAASLSAGGRSTGALWFQPKVHKHPPAAAYQSGGGPGPPGHVRPRFPKVTTSPVIRRRR